MAKNSKVEKTSTSGFGVNAGKGHMIQGTSAGPQKPGQSASQKSGGGKFPVGGKGHMFGDQKATPAKAGQSGHATGGGNDTFGVKGGTTKMFGKQTADTAKPR